MNSNRSLKKCKSIQVLQTSELSFEKLKRFHIQLLSTHVSTHVIFLGYNSGMCSISIENTFWRALKKKDLNTLETTMCTWRSPAVESNIPRLIGQVTQTPCKFKFVWKMNVYFIELWRLNGIMFWTQCSNWQPVSNLY